MIDCRSSIGIRVPADDVFDFVSRPENMPRYMDTVTAVVTRGSGEVEIIGEVEGRSYRSEGWFEVDGHHLMMRWGANGDSSYAGHMTVTPMDEGSCKVEVHLLFASTGPEDVAGAARTNERVLKTLDDALESIKAITELAPHLLTSQRRGYMA
jgi:uncharacterized protein YndB with AHSA1/START domain